MDSANIQMVSEPFRFNNPDPVFSMASEFSYHLLPFHTPIHMITRKSQLLPHLTKNLLSISKLTSDFPLSVTFTNNLMTIKNRQTGRVVATDKRDGGLYVLERGNSAFISALRNKSLRASYDLWHARLSHVNHSIISFLNRKCHLSLTSLLPSPSLCNIVRLRKVIDCLIPAMNVGRLMC